MSGTLDLSSLNDRQRTIATTLDAPLFVEAGAGSGKTFTLTQRIAWALSPGSGSGGAPFLDGLDQVLVITFTEAAAREIKERTRRTLRSAGLAEQALAVDDAWISTIHGMCSRILRRHALDLGLDPAFAVVADSAQTALFDRAMDEVMRAARSDDAFAPALAEYGLGMRGKSGYTGAMGLVETMVEAGASCTGGVSSLSPEAVGADSLREALDAFTMRMEELGACKLTPAARGKVDPALEALRDFACRPLRERTPEAVRDLLEGMAMPTASGALKEAVRSAKAARALALAEARFCAAAPHAGALLELARRVERRYRELKVAERCLDNDDLVREALLAVRDNDEVRRDYAGRFRLVMVDEFQDTDETQLELIGLLAGGDGAHLCTVGDAQQSIYRFRGADVGVFRAHGEKVDEAGTVRLDTNYRSHADVLALVERACTGGDGTAPGVLEGFMHLDDCPTRTDGYRARDLPRIDVEVCSGRGVAGRPSRHQVATMAAQVADALATYRAHGERAGDMALLLGVTTNAELYIDAIRARGMECVVTGGSTFTSTDEVKVMCALLHTLANPADTQSGLFPLLASEMFGLDANDFCELGSRTQEKLDAPTKRGIDRGMATMEFYGGHEPSMRLARAHEVLGRALEQVRWRPVADVCLDVARDSGWLARLEAEGTEGRARAANVLAAVRYVRDLTEGLGLGAARAATEFDAWLRVAKVPPASLAGDDGAAGDGTVRVMTIHASKGLEFGVCAVAECWSRPQSDATLALGPLRGGRRSFVLRPRDDEHKLSALLGEIDAEELEPGAGGWEAMPLAARYAALRAEDAAADARERARLLYVAMTRAREALVLGVSAASGKEGVPSSALAAGTLEALLGDPCATRAGETELDYGGSAPARLRCVEVSTEGRGADKAVTASSGGTLGGFDGPLPERAADAVRPGVAGEEAAAGEAGVGTFALYEMVPPAAPPTGYWRARAGVFSYSSVHAQLAPPPAPTREQRAAEAAGEADAEDADRATNLGSAFHELAQAMVESGRAADEARVRSQVRRWHLSPRAEERLRGALARWERSSVRAEALSWPLVRAEVPFFQPQQDSPHGDYLEGAMDLLCTDEAAHTALVVDYKTGDAGLSPEEVGERHAMQAEFYAGVLLAEGFGRVECAFVCVEREDPDATGEPLVARYAFGA
ncbi:UvrD-helicase domain-containing protein [Olsenella sp. DSM 107455]|uniref:DNA 3'-5' helicase n=1 Tax=Thermophilibacter gallinarum TaxID=2779357 RepID=A0ABR9QRZ4_9ACTN|nr:UvrD-helicase domain-containing protein [Thermophilibacter gallinarum]